MAVQIGKTRVGRRYHVRFGRSEIFGWLKSDAVDADGGRWLAFTGCTVVSGFPGSEHAVVDTHVDYFAEAPLSLATTEAR
ncbi:MAG: hypothetical protein JWO85_241 [Candidatus Eremiobacteraeota bacterium]|nr:hypothetical protein [Candidatus Eremiobacteraeota bacterium]